MNLTSHFRLGALAFLVAAGLNCDSNTSRTQSNTPATASKPSFSVVDGKSDDTPLMTLVETRIVVDAPFSRQRVTEALKSQFQSDSERTGFKYHDTPTHVRVFAFARRETALAGWGHAIGRIEKMGPEDKQEIFVDDRLLAEWNKPEETINNMQQEQRFKICSAYWLSLTASLKSEKEKGRFPSADQLSEPIKNTLVKQYGITMKQLKEILLEGDVKGW